jgi:hypothetical protein
MTANLLSGLIFGSIGLAAFLYGRKNDRYKTTTIGLLLMTYPWFVPHNSIALFLIGAALVAALFLFKH